MEKKAGEGKEKKKKEMQRQEEHTHTHAQSHTHTWSRCCAPRNGLSAQSFLIISFQCALRPVIGYANEEQGNATMLPILLCRLVHPATDRPPPIQGVSCNLFPGMYHTFGDKNNWANMAREVGIDVGFVKQVSFTYGHVDSNFNYLLADLYTAGIYA